MFEEKRLSDKTAPNRRAATPRPTLEHCRILATTQNGERHNKKRQAKAKIADTISQSGQCARGKEQSSRDQRKGGRNEKDQTRRNQGEMIRLFVAVDAKNERNDRGRNKGWKSPKTWLAIISICPPYHERSIAIQCQPFRISALSC